MKTLALILAALLLAAPAWAQTITTVGGKQRDGAFYDGCPMFIR